MITKGLNAIRWGLNNVFLRAFVHTFEQLYVTLIALKIFDLLKETFWLELICSI